MTAILLAMMLIIMLGPDTTGQTLLSKKMEGVPEVFVTSPTLMNVTVFSRTFGHWGCSAKALESLRITAESLAVVANFGEQARSELGAGPRQGTEQIMIGMRSEKLLDVPPIEAELLFDRKKHLYETQSQETLGFDRGCGARKFGSTSKDLHASRPLVATPKPAAVQKVLTMENQLCEPRCA
jgi:hypothetical protein